MFYQSNIQAKEVLLYVHDRKKQTQFYTERIGLQVLEETEQEVVLGVATTALVRLQEVSTPKVASYGLYHIALVVPTRKDLGEVLRHLLETKTPLVGGSDHGYSEAIYLNDPEGNGIEIYRDKPVSVWDIQEDGRIIGVTEMLDGDGLLAEAPTVQTPYRLPDGTRMGHIHLSVRDALASSQFYQQALGMNDKFTVPSASWIAGGMYHHHLAFNEWAGKQLSKRQDKMPGLGYIVLEVDSEAVLQQIATNVQALQKPIQQEKQTITFTDPDGLVVKIMIKEL